VDGRVAILEFILTRFSGTGREKTLHELRREDVETLHESIEAEWDEWVRRATSSGIPGWSNDAFLLENVPITIVVRYGQNQQVCLENQEDRREEGRHWQRLHQYANMRTMTFALATHIQ
jgi:hypothetical protein